MFKKDVFEGDNKFLKNFNFKKIREKSLIYLLGISIFLLNEFFYFIKREDLWCLIQFILMVVCLPLLYFYLITTELNNRKKILGKSIGLLFLSIAMFTLFFCQLYEYDDKSFSGVEATIEDIDCIVNFFMFSLDGFIGSDISPIHPENIYAKFIVIEEKLFVFSIFTIYVTFFFSNQDNEKKSSIPNEVYVKNLVRVLNFEKKGIYSYSMISDDCYELLTPYNDCHNNSFSIFISFLENEQVKFSDGRFLVNEFRQHLGFQKLMSIEKEIKTFVDKYVFDYEKDEFFWIVHVNDICDNIDCFVESLLDFQSITYGLGERHELKCVYK